MEQGGAAVRKRPSNRQPEGNSELRLRVSLVVRSEANSRQTLLSRFYCNCIMRWQVSISMDRVDVSLGQKNMGFYPLMPTPFCQVCSCPLENGRCRRSADHSKFLRKTYAIGWYNKLRSGSSDLLSKH